MNLEAEKKAFIGEMAAQVFTMDADDFMRLKALFQFEEKNQEEEENNLLFWELIEKIDWSKTDTEERVKPLIDALAQTDILNINEFSEQLARYLHHLDGPVFYEALKSRKDGVSSDTFLYARCMTVAKGKSFYEEVLKNPRKIPKEEDFEALLYVAKEAYQQKTNEEYQYVPSVIYESFFNKLLWEEKVITL